MSHVATVDLHVKDLDALAAAAQDCGCELIRGQESYKWFGKSVGDYPLPEGFAAQDLGKCAHAIRIPGAANAYEVGVVARRDGKPGYTLLWDFWRGGFGLQDKIGDGAKKLRAAYAVQVAVKKLRATGARVTITKQEGKTVIRATK